MSAQRSRGARYRGYLSYRLPTLYCKKIMDVCLKICKWVTEDSLVAMFSICNSEILLRI